VESRSISTLDDEVRDTESPIDKGMASTDVVEIHEEIAPDAVDTIDDALEPYPVDTIDEVVEPYPVDTIDEVLEPYPVDEIGTEAAPDAVEEIDEEIAPDADGAIDEVGAPADESPWSVDTIEVVESEFFVEEVVLEEEAPPSTEETQDLPEVESGPMEVDPTATEVAGIDVEIESPSPEVEEEAPGAAEPGIEDLSSFTNEVLAEASAAPEAPQVERAPPTPERVERFGRRDPHERARHLARVLVSDIIAYYPVRYQESLARRTLQEDFADEIQKSYREYVDQVGLEIAESTPYFVDALNHVLGRGEKFF
jgi:hypothetical protein